VADNPALKRWAKLVRASGTAAEDARVRGLTPKLAKGGDGGCEGRRKGAKEKLETAWWLMGKQISPASATLGVGMTTSVGARSKKGPGAEILESKPLESF
jgi:hypothetical protein